MKKLMLLPVLLLSTGIIFAGGKSEAPAAPAAKVEIQILTAEVLTADTLKLRSSGVPEDLSQVTFSIEPGTPAAKAQRAGGFIELKSDTPLKSGTTYTVTAVFAGSTSSAPVNTAALAEAEWNAMVSDKVLGYTFDKGQSVFRLFVPRGTAVNVVIFDKYDDPLEKARVIPMANDGNQIFEAQVPGALWGKYYGYQITGRSYDFGKMTPDYPGDTVFADPYSKAVAQSNSFPQKNRSLIIDTSKYNWEGDKPLALSMSEMVIMEAHIRDLTAHPTAGTTTPGYKGMINATRGGIKWLKDLGVNAVEFLPLQDFGNTEPPFDVLAGGIKQKWNAYSRNYWGYMTSNYFAPETYYGSDGTMDPAKWNGTDGRAVNEFKDMVKTLHKNGIAVVMDVVYNHTASYDENTFKLIDKDYYFKKADKTGTGNEIESRRAMVRRMMLDSIRHWMTEYHVDGFRFDLATSHDKETIKQIADMAYAINPKAILVAEPWGGEQTTTATDFLKAGWAKWNDGIRSAIRGENRPRRPGNNFALGNGESAERLKEYWKGGVGGFQSWQMVNYIESHDDTTFGDNLRIQSGTYNFLGGADGKTIQRITDVAAYQKLDDRLLAASKVGAISLFLSQGSLMLHIGQEWSRGKVTPDTSAAGIKEITNKGPIGSSSDNVVFLTPSPNTYSADNEVNWINFDHAALNQSLVDYYKGLIRLRTSQKLLGGAAPSEVTLMDNPVAKALGTNISGKIFGFVNADPQTPASFILPEGTYSVMADKDRASAVPLREIQGGSITVPPQSGMILIKK